MKPPASIRPAIDDCHPIPSVAHIFLRHLLLQTPMYFIRWIYALIYSLYLLFVLRAPTDSDIIGYIENTTLAMLVCPSNSGEPDEYEWKVADCKLSTTDGHELKNISLSYKKTKGDVRLLQFSRNGSEIEDRSQIFSTLFFYHAVSLHTKSHLFSNSLVRYIVDNRIETLRESTYTSIPLHHGLLHSDRSSLQSEGTVSNCLGYGFPCGKACVMAESLNMSAIVGHQTKRRWTLHGLDGFTGKLFRSRQALRDVMARYEIDEKLLEPLFNHTIVHSVDHQSGVQRTGFRFSLHPWHTGCTALQAFNTNMFRVLLCSPTLNPLAPNTIRSINKPFYQDLYLELQKIDPEMADWVTASVMY